MKIIIKNNKAITLIALVITIIVLLILAGITVAQLSGNGLFESAKLAKEKYKKSRDLEDSTLEDYEDAITGDRGNKINYSTNEQDTGIKWIDGKTIWQKSFSFTITSGATYVPIEVSNINEILKIDAIGRGSDRTTPIPSTYANGTGSTVAWYCGICSCDNKTKLLIESGSSFASSNPNVYTTIQYTKTTN